MEEYQIRVVKEANELQEKLTKLKTFIDGDVYKRLSRKERKDLFEQKVYMQQYLRVLDRRIEGFKNFGTI